MSPAIGPVTVLPPADQESPYGQDGVAPATKQFAGTSHPARQPEPARPAGAHSPPAGTLDEDEAYAAADISRDTALAAVARAGAQ